MSELKLGGQYLLKGHKAVRCSLVEFANASKQDRRVARTQVGKFDVSTVFLGLDHNFGDGPPLLFETMVFGGESEEMERYSTWEEAEAGHEEMVARYAAMEAGDA